MLTRGVSSPAASMSSFSRAAKLSLFGDHSVYGPEGVGFYTHLKTVTARWPAGFRDGSEFNFPSPK